MLRLTVSIAVIFSFYYVGVLSDYLHDYHPKPIAAEIDWKKVQGKWSTFCSYASSPESMEINVANGNYGNGSVKLTYSNHNSIEYGQIDIGLYGRSQISVQYYDTKEKNNITRIFIPVQVEYNDSYMIFVTYPCLTIKKERATAGKASICSLFNRMIDHPGLSIMKKVESNAQELYDKKYKNQPNIDCAN